MVFMPMMRHEAVLNSVAHTQPVKPRDVLDTNGFRVLIHLDTVEDMMFYRYPKADLIVDGKAP
jgi:hypothetical protein